MFKYLKTFYDFLMKLKQYHAVHVIVIPQILTLPICYCYTFYIAICGFKPEDDIYGFTIISALGLCLFYIYILPILSLFTATIIFVIQKLTTTKLKITSPFLLYNSFFNVIYLLTLINYIITVLVFIVGDLGKYLCFICTIPYKFVSLLNNF